MIHVNLPYDHGTFVKVKDTDGNIAFYGRVAGYAVYKDGYTVYISEGSGTVICGEFLPEEVEPLTAQEIAEL